MEKKVSKIPDSNSQSVVSKILRCVGASTFNISKQQNLIGKGVIYNDRKHII